MILVARQRLVQGQESGYATTAGVSLLAFSSGLPRADLILEIASTDLPMRSIEF
jgi:hypothetical protein